MTPISNGCDGWQRKSCPRWREPSQPGGDEWFGRQRAGAKDASCPVPPERTLYRHARLLWFGRFDGVKAILRQMAAAIFANRSEEHTSALQSLMRISYAVFCLKKKT